MTKAVTVRVIGGASGEHAGQVTVAHSGDSVVVSSAKGARLQGLRFIHSDGDADLRGRNGPRCLEVYAGHLTVESCFLTSRVGSAVMAADGGSLMMRRCTLKGCGRCGLICVLGSWACCESCELSHNALNGADVQTGGCVVLRGNRVSNNLQTGVLVADERSFVHIEGNDISDNMRRGVTAQKSGSFVLVSNRIYRNKNIGVIGIGPWEDESEPLKIEGNLISGNLSSGLWVQKGNANVINNVITANGESGVVAFGCVLRLVFRDNVIYGNGRTGVSIHTAKEAIIQNNSIGTQHISLPDAFHEAFLMGRHDRLGEQSLIRDLDEAVCFQIVRACGQDRAGPNSGSGLEVQFSQALVTDNVIAHSGEAGVLMTEGSEVELRGNKIYGSAGAG
eukprot:CAMPEP_0173413208 /NCGR_PEP_ID=MMETSP1356-20130122/81461_1 /TAXON_ID=77927 ORGANISM="Hemiselmis virescens, Strain PCC157" /NCGR_SAMPLE_ID=MMETSP1356 /ASSEMBLY_ACC=CAM_ASM_000847 /LENGTH=391 /DNA_ID=CAMNT_0014375219 /DNA_START=54 /DNA_END=1226 /DNA_ORIENTATION=+